MTLNQKLRVFQRRQACSASSWGNMNSAQYLESEPRGVESLCSSPRVSAGCTECPHTYRRLSCFLMKGLMGVLQARGWSCSPEIFLRSRLPFGPPCCLLKRGLFADGIQRLDWLQGGNCCTPGGAPPSVRAGQGRGVDWVWYFSHTRGSRECGPGNKRGCLSTVENDPDEGWRPLWVGSAVGGSWEWTGEGRLIWGAMFCLLAASPVLHQRNLCLMGGRRLRKAA